MVQSTVSPAETVRNHPDTEIVAKMDPALKAKWIEALRSGKYKQCHGQLRSDRGEFCCLGVLCDVVDAGSWEAREGRLDAYKFEDDVSAMCLPHGLKEKLNITREQQEQCWRMNDLRGCSFREIADYIEQNL